VSVALLSGVQGWQDDGGPLEPRVCSQVPPHGAAPAGQRRLGQHGPGEPPSHRGPRRHGSMSRPVTARSGPGVPRRSIQHVLSPIPVIRPGQLVSLPLRGPLGAGGGLTWWVVVGGCRCGTCARAAVCAACTGRTCAGTGWTWPGAASSQQPGRQPTSCRYAANHPPPPKHAVGLTRTWGRACTRDAFAKPSSGSHWVANQWCNVRGGPLGCERTQVAKCTWDTSESPAFSC
jgi:hypothetical protein